MNIGISIRKTLGICSRHTDLLILFNKLDIDYFFVIVLLQWLDIKKSLDLADE